MPFADVPRVNFRKNPLEQVICQLKYPTILKIESDLPSDFQDRIRADYPFLETDASISLPAELSSQIPMEILQRILPSDTSKNYAFKSDDDQWKVNLTKNFIALTAMEYTSWEQFQEKLLVPYNAFKDIYNPSVYVRIGLRYVDVINRTKLGLTNRPWRDLLKGPILGLHSDQLIADHIAASEGRTIVELDDGKGYVQIMTRLQKDENDETCFVIDSDFYTEDRISDDQALELLDFYRIRASRWMQSCITDELREAMEPQAL